ncbi:hypothetical protein [Planotetraspora kaengkrachanensis]|nr:hypothetical protein [Planotetraspora kaengkrachanensis]
MASITVACFYGMYRGAINLGVEGIPDVPGIGWAACFAFVWGVAALMAREDIARAKLALARAEEDPRERLQRRVARVNSLFTEATALMDDLRRDLEAQQATRQALLEETEHQQHLLEVNKDEAEKIRKLFVGETEKSIRAARLREWMFLLIGLAASIPIGLLVNWMS